MIDISKQLQTLVEHGTEKYPLPYKKGNTIFIGKCTIRKNRYGFILFKDGEQVEMFNTLHGALATVKRLLKRKSYQDILYLDKMYSKHDGDMVFYQYNLERTHSEIKKDNLEIRLEDSRILKQSYRDRLENIIFN